MGIVVQKAIYGWPASRTGRARPVFRILAFFRNLPGPYVQILVYIDHFPRRKKFGPMGLLWGTLGAPFHHLLQYIFNFWFRLLKIGPYNPYSKDVVVGSITCNLESCCCRPNSSWPVHGGQVIILCQIHPNIMGNMPTKKFCYSFKTQAAPAIFRYFLAVCSDFHYIA